MRLNDWEQRLTAYLFSRSRMPFRPGKNDCAMFTAGAVEAMTGEDYGAPLRGYRTVEGGKKKLTDAGFYTHIDYVASLFEEVPHSLAQRGDIAVVDAPQGEALGIVQGEYVYVMTPSGLGYVPIVEAKKAFRV